MKGTQIPVITPFDHRGALDLPSLARLARHCLACGAESLIVFGAPAETTQLTATEQRAILETLRATGAKLTVSIVALTTEHAVRQVGAHAEFADEFRLRIPSHFDEASRASLAEAAVPVPVMVEDAASRDRTTPGDVAALKAALADQGLISSPTMRVPVAAVPSPRRRLSAMGGSALLAMPAG